MGSLGDSALPVVSAVGFPGERRALKVAVCCHSEMGGCNFYPGAGGAEGGLRAPAPGLEWGQGLAAGAGTVSA
jgi:hypothetical protein